MPVYTIQTPEGRKLKIEAADEASAIRGAEEWSAAQAAAAPKPKAPPTPKDPGPAEVWLGTMRNAKDAFVEGVKSDYDHIATRRPPRNLLETGRATVEDWKRTGRLVGDTVNLLASPVSGGFEALVVEPYGDIMSGIFKGTDQAGWEGDMRTALMAARPGAKSAGAVAKAPKAPSPKVVARREAVARFERAGVDPTMAAVEGGGASRVANAIAENPAGFRQRAQLRKSVTQAGESARRVAGGYGSSRGAQITGENVQAGVRRFGRDTTSTPDRSAAPAKQTSFSSKATKLYDEAFLPIETAEGQAVAKAANAFETAKASAANERARMIAQQQADYESALAAETERVAGLRARGYTDIPPAQIERPRPPAEPDVPPQRPAVTPTQTMSTLRELGGRVNARRLSNIVTDGRIKSILGALEEDGADVRFNDLRALRTWVRNAQRDPTLRQGMDQAGLQRIEQALTADIYGNAERLAGPKAVADLRRADTYYRAGSQRIQRALQPFDDAQSGESAYARIVQAAGSNSSADAQKLLSLKRSLSSEEWGDVAANVINELGKPSKGATGAMEPDAFSVNNFVSNYNALSPRAKAVLFDSVGGGGAKASALRQELDNLAVVADKLKAVEKGANASNTGVSLQALGTLGGLVTATVPTSKLLGGLMLTGEALTNPAVIRWMARLGQAEVRGPKEVSATAKLLGKAARANAALQPLYEEVNRQISAGSPEPAPQAAPASAIPER